MLSGISTLGTHQRDALAFEHEAIGEQVARKHFPTGFDLTGEEGEGSDAHAGVQVGCERMRIRSLSHVLIRVTLPGV